MHCYWFFVAAVVIVDRHQHLVFIRSELKKFVVSCYNKILQSLLHGTQRMEVHMTQYGHIQQCMEMDYYLTECINAQELPYLTMSEPNDAECSDICCGQCDCCCHRLDDVTHHYSYDKGPQ